MRSYAGYSYQYCIAKKSWLILCSNLPYKTPWAYSTMYRRKTITYSPSNEETSCERLKMFLRVAFCGISVVLVFRVLLDMLCMKAAELADRLVNPTGNYYYDQEKTFHRRERRETRRDGKFRGLLNMKVAEVADRLVIPGKSLFRPRKNFPSERNERDKERRKVQGFAEHEGNRGRGPTCKYP